MFIDAPYLSIAADLRHRELLADAENFRLAKLARAARRVTRRVERPPQVRPPAAGPEPTGPGSDVDADRRSLVPR